MIRPHPLLQIHIRKQLARSPVRPAHHHLSQITMTNSESRRRHTGHRLFQQPALMFAVKPLGRIVRLQHALKQVEMVMRLAADGALEATVEQALMRGLITA
jgi:hypothetical protein